MHDPENANGSGVQGGRRTAIRPETSSEDSNVIAEKGEMLEGGSFSDARVARRKRSHFRERRPGTSTLRGVSVAAAALGILLISLVTVRFIVCFKASMSYRTTPRGVFPGVTSRKLAKRQKEERLSLIPAGADESESAPAESVLLGESSVTYYRQMSKCVGSVVENVAGLDTVVNVETPAGVDQPQSDFVVDRPQIHLGSQRLRWLPKPAISSVLFSVLALIILAVTICGVVGFGFSLGGQTGIRVAIAGAVLSGLASVFGLVFVIREWKKWRERHEALVSHGGDDTR